MTRFGNRKGNFWETRQKIGKFNLEKKKHATLEIFLSKIWLEIAIETANWMISNNGNTAHMFHT